jgi:tRNA pseudouridine13 synthase
MDMLRPPLLTADLPGIGGRIKEQVDDFQVEEIPAYPPCGKGEFLYLWIEKRDMGAEFFTRQVARRLDIPASEVGTAGLKDRRAVTTQMVSVPASAEPNLARLEGDGIRVLNVSRHSNKLRAGHLHGNRFRVLVRGADATRDSGAIMARLKESGLPNFYGPQRFGRDGETLTLGWQMIRGESVPRHARSPFLRKLALSSVQSALFNSYLAQRLADGLLRTVLAGDIMAKYPFGGMFEAEDAVREQARFDAREVVTAGPIFGRKMFPARAEAAAREEHVLAAHGLTREAFLGFGKLFEGTRRHNLVYVDDLALEKVDEGIWFSFSLPAGSYATVLLSEFMKVEVLDES